MNIKVYQADHREEPERREQNRFSRVIGILNRPSWDDTRIFVETLSGEIISSNNSGDERTHSPEDVVSIALADEGWIHVDKLVENRAHMMTIIAGIIVEQPMEGCIYVPYISNVSSEESCG